MLIVSRPSTGSRTGTQHDVTPSVCHRKQDRDSTQQEAGAHFSTGASVYRSLSVCVGSQLRLAVHTSGASCKEPSRVSVPPCETRPRLGLHSGAEPEPDSCRKTKFNRAEAKLPARSAWFLHHLHITLPHPSPPHHTGGLLLHPPLSCELRYKNQEDGFRLSHTTNA